MTKHLFPITLILIGVTVTGILVEKFNKISYNTIAWVGDKTYLDKGYILLQLGLSERAIPVFQEGLIYANQKEDLVLAYIKANTIDRIEKGVCTNEIQTDLLNMYCKKFEKSTHKNLSSFGHTKRMSEDLTLRYYRTHVHQGRIKNLISNLLVIIEEDNPLDCMQWYGMYTI